MMPVPAGAARSVAVADTTALVTNDNDGGEGEATTTLHDLRDAIDRDELVGQFVVLVAVARPIAIARGTAGTTG